MIIGWSIVLILAFIFLAAAFVNYFMKRSEEMTALFFIVSGVMFLVFFMAELPR